MLELKLVCVAFLREMLLFWVGFFIPLLAHLFICVALGTGYVMKLSLPYQAAALAQLWGLFKSLEENHQLLHLDIGTQKVIC